MLAQRRLHTEIRGEYIDGLPPPVALVAGERGLIQILGFFCSVTRIIVTVSCHLLIVDVFGFLFGFYRVHRLDELRLVFLGEDGQVVLVFRLLLQPVQLGLCISHQYLGLFLSETGVTSTCCT